MVFRSSAVRIVPKLDSVEALFPKLEARGS